MAVIKAVSSKAGIGQAIDYVTKEEKTEEKLVSGLHCEAETAKEEMQATKELWEKTGGRTYKHFVQSYHKDEKITPEQAFDAKMLDDAINRFLRALPDDARNTFIGRYYFFDSLKEVATYCGMSEAKAKSMLYRTRQSLKAYLVKEGFDL